MITGLTGSGKTRLAWAVCDILQREGWEIIVFDPVGVWNRSPIPKLIRVESNTVNILKIYDSTVIDMSRLRISEQRELLDRFAEWLFKDRVENPSQRKTLIVIEEFSSIVKNIKSSVSENLYRLAFVGRNLNVRLMYVDPRLNSICAEFRFLAGQKYLGFANEENVTRKIKSLYGKDWAEIVKTLQVGEFVYVKASKSPELIRVPLYIPSTKPAEIIVSEPIRPTIPEMVGYALGLGISVLFLYPLIKILSFF